MARRLIAASVRVVVPEITDYELRRELLRAAKTAGDNTIDANMCQRTHRQSLS
jgi:hypothetical protein